MPNAMTHGRIGAVSGLAATFLIPDDLPPDARLTVCAAALVGGHVGGGIPDLIEPALHAWHRAFFHSAAAGTGVIWLGTTSVVTATRRLLDEAAQVRAHRLALAASDPTRNDLWLHEHVRYVLVGLLIGLTAGYVSHLVADATTPRSLPVLGLKRLAS